ncbi:Chymotrypsinogen A [Pseudolycoriella hygida]|uniref:Chymotrypsinogen A n=1 Tax=Pseudolycoriella hygida TaxID=35572 RepID=A0A9Q0NBB8_9DIPT|nr:Chymotrypsinogen A [Pseudolycoriella hygida]
MKLIVFAIFLATVTARTTDFTSERNSLVVPDNQNDFLERVRQTVPRQRNTITGRISNGNEAANGQFPWVTRLTIVDEPFDTFVCTGNIISSNFILTVRHCFDPVITVQVIADAGDIDRLSNNIVTRFSDFWWFAPVMQPGNFQPDLAVVRTSAPFVFNNRINTIRLPALSQEAFEWPGQQMRIVGWGRDATGNMPRFLQYGNFRMQTNCWSQRRQTHLCSVAENINVETRGGDSGGPWVVVEGGIPTLVALHEGSTGSSTLWWFRGLRITSFLNFIHSVTGIPIRS